ncbi:hypothetical protein Gohar_022540, partial [Gossypium harknessii]|nr:hypothetical protein [Gossypium harknessii]
SSGCFGCCTKPTPIIAVDEPTKGLRIRGRRVRKPSISDDFWSSSTYELENSALQSQRSLSSISASNPTLSQCSSSSGIVNPSDFVNQGKFCLIVWNQARLQWIGSNRPRNHTRQSRQPRLSFSWPALIFLSYNNDLMCRKWLIFWWKYGKKRDCMLEVNIKKRKKRVQSFN